MLTQKIFLSLGIILMLVFTSMACDAQQERTTTPAKPIKENDALKTTSSASETKEQTEKINSDSLMIFKESASTDFNQYKDGKKEGLWRDYNGNGQLKSEGYFRDGKKEKIHREWWENGVLFSEGHYENGKANGIMRWYHEQGHLAGEGPMKEGQRDGLWKVYSVEVGQLTAEVYFKAGKELGVFKSYDEKGQLRRENTWQEDQIIHADCWDENGKAIDCI